MAVTMNSDDFYLVIDSREMNEGRQERYDVFWETLGSYLEG